MDSCGLTFRICLNMFYSTTLESPSPDCMLTVWFKWDFGKVYLSLLTEFSNKSQPLMLCTNLSGYYN